MKAIDQPCVLITGANGYVGSNLGFSLRSKGLQPTLSDKGLSPILSDLPYRPCNFLNKNDIRALLAEQNYDYVYFFTGRTGTSLEAKLRKEEFIEGNEKTLLNLLEVIAELNHKPRVIFPSTRLIYRGGLEQFLHEESELEPKSVYAENKLACEEMLWQFNRSHDIDFTIFRISLPYASNLPMDKVSYGVMAFLLGKARNGEGLEIYGDGAQRVSLIHIDDLTQILWFGGTHPGASAQVFNIGGPDSMPMGEVLEQIAVYYKVPLTRIAWPNDMKSSDLGHLALSSDKIVKLLGYTFERHFAEWISGPKVKGE